MLSLYLNQFNQMKKFFFLALSLSVSFGVASAQTTVPAPAANQKIVTDGPIINFVENKFDFGSIKEGEIVSHTFKFKNSGNQPLVVSEVRVTCGCTTPDWTKTPVAPGQTGFITAQFNSTGKPGQNHKVITVISNSVTGNTPISFIADVTPRDNASSAVDRTPAAAPAVAVDHSGHNHNHTPVIPAAANVKKNKK